MGAIPEIKKIAFLGDYFPRKCGIATFTHDLRGAVAAGYPAIDCFVAPVSDRAEGYDYGPEVRFEFSENDLDSYIRTAEYLNFSGTDVVCLQHEYGIFGGPAGSFILALLRDLRIPVVTTLHTVLEKPSAEQRRVLQELALLSSRLVVMSERGRRMLREIYDVPEKKIDLIPHGIPDMPFTDPNFLKDQFQVEGKQVLLTFGLLSPNKGIEYVLRALPEVVRQFPNLVYIVLGATHPNLVRDHGEIYRLSLERLAADLGITRHVSFYNRFVELDELTDFLGVADLYITPYLNPAQITSGTLAYAYGGGKAVISTPYWHAEELLADGKGVLVPFADSEAIAREVVALLRDDKRRHAMRKAAYVEGRGMIWERAAHRYMASFERARSHPTSQPIRRMGVRTLDEKRLELPALRLDHLAAMSDSTGLLQHAIYSLPDYAHGYCTDDNARALIATLMLEELELDLPEVRRLTDTYASFMQYAFDPGARRFRNFMSYDRKWLEASGSEDSQGRALWALGTCVGRSRRSDLQSWAAQLFERALPPLLDTTSPRTWAFALLGIYEYFRRLNGDRMAAQIRDVLTQRLIDLYEANASEKWGWFEDTVSYDNARLSQVLILSGRWADNPKAFEIGLKSLRWLVDVQKSPGQMAHFRPIGSEGFYKRGGKPALFDQQPVEALATISACLEAYRSTNDPAWHREARIAFEWFLGRNDLGLALCDPKTGACCDGLHIDRVNQNRGAESTLSYLISLSEMKLLENNLKAFHEPLPLPPVPVPVAALILSTPS
ncbi:Glycosyltransferase involved in cell wall bisynthesis [Verrucomicrobium sp. GAS474]|uniref:glycosyltransferase family 4 protein n=1 Tax=Verrucomicrobium sp. GAS474 TaxID=1882831 RepID=UPI00087C7D41|nr:glycosyltransferase family 4 protein [Verrucomicrobium sp. GAS474]SDT97471.1 Glycosyltransferase involved in cell wall bisynthesis [Verrucomicrobium sp. GAS474]